MSLDNITEEQGKIIIPAKKKINYNSKEFIERMNKVKEEAEYMKKLSLKINWPMPGVYFKQSA